MRCSRDGGKSHVLRRIGRIEYLPVRDMKLLVLRFEEEPRDLDRFAPDILRRQANSPSSAHRAPAHPRSRAEGSGVCVALQYLYRLIAHP